MKRLLPGQTTPKQPNSASPLDTGVGCRIPAAGPFAAQSVAHRPATPSLRNLFKMENLNQNQILTESLTDLMHKSFRTTNLESSIGCEDVGQGHRS